MLLSAKTKRKHLIICKQTESKMQANRKQNAREKENEKEGENEIENEIENEDDSPPPTPSSITHRQVSSSKDFQWERDDSKSWRSCVNGCLQSGGDTRRNT